MKIHLLRSPELSKDTFRAITQVIGKERFPLEFVFDKNDINGNDDPGEENEQEEGKAQELQMLSWSYLFGKCEEYRKHKKDVRNEDLVVWFTDHSNEENWFSSWDPSGKRNFFIQTSGWENYIQCESHYPIVYELVTLPFYLSVSDSLEEVERIAHREPRGCPFDYCLDKRQASLRLRTGDLCPECRDRLIAKKANPALISQVFRILDRIRGQMLFSRRLALSHELSRIKLDLHERELIFTDLGGRSVRLSPQQMTIYCFFLKHPKGVELRHIKPVYFNEIKDIYSEFASEALIAKIDDAIQNMLKNPNQSVSGLIHDINNKILDSIGEELGKNYTIVREQVDGVEYKHLITLGRDLISYDPDNEKTRRTIIPVDIPRHRRN